MTWKFNTKSPDTHDELKKQNNCFKILLRNILKLISYYFQQTANVLLILTAALIGLLLYILGEAKHRRAFVEAKQSLEVKTLIEEQSAEQVIY